MKEEIAQLEKLVEQTKQLVHEAINRYVQLQLAVRLLKQNMEQLPDQDPLPLPTIFDKDVH